MTRNLADAEITLPQGTVRYRDTGGDGAPIVFLHGLLVDGRLWDGVLGQLAGHRLIVPDWPLGAHRTALHADADLTPPGLARIVADALAALEVGDATLVANDTGGAIAQILVTRHPERVGRLVLTNCDAYQNFLPAMFRPLQAAARVPGLPWLLTRALRAHWVQRLPVAFGRLSRPPLDHALVDSWLEPARVDAAVRRDLVKILKGISSRYTIEAARALHTYDRPVLIAWGRADPFFTPRYAERLAAEFTDATLEWIDDARALVPLDQPAQLAKLITSFAGG